MVQALPLRSVRWHTIQGHAEQGAGARIITQFAA